MSLLSNEMNNNLSRSPVALTEGCNTNQHMSPNLIQEEVHVTIHSSEATSHRPTRGTIHLPRPTEVEYTIHDRTIGATHVTTEARYTSHSSTEFQPHQAGDLFPRRRYTVTFIDDDTEDALDAEKSPLPAQATDNSDSRAPPQRVNNKYAAAETTAKRTTV